MNGPSFATAIHRNFWRGSVGSPGMAPGMAPGRTTW